jgi:hypothetical protein
MAADQSTSSSTQATIASKLDSYRWVIFHASTPYSGERSETANVQIGVSPLAGLYEEALMQKWKITFVDDHGETVDEVFECDECPDNEQAARLIKERLLPVAAQLDLNDFEGRTADASVKDLKTQNSIQILGITPI